MRYIFLALIYITLSNNLIPALSVPATTSPARLNAIWGTSSASSHLQSPGEHELYRCEVSTYPRARRSRTSSNNSPRLRAYWPLRMFCEAWLLSLSDISRCESREPLKSRSGEMEPSLLEEVDEELCLLLLCELDPYEEVRLCKYRNPYID